MGFTLGELLDELARMMDRLGHNAYVQIEVDGEIVEIDRVDYKYNGREDVVTVVASDS